MIVKCPECNKEISSQAIQCPHCGYPLSDKVNIRKSRRPKLPNGFGQITKLKNPNLRNPYRVMVHIGVNSEGRPISKLLKPKCYFKSYNEAYAALSEYHKNPYDVKNDLTLAELFDKWQADHFDKNANPSHRKNNITIFKRLKPIEGARIQEMRPLMLKSFIESLDVTPDYKARIKYLLNMLFDYAVSLELVDRNISRNFELSTTLKSERKSKTKNHFAFTDTELITLWKASESDKYAKSIIIQCYMGWRPNEMCALKRENINWSKMQVTGGSKTEAGRNRIVPIHPCIKDLLLEKYNSKGPLFDSYKYYRTNFHKLMTELSLSKDHTPHDCRTTFITNCKKYLVNEYAIKYMVGHTIEDLTERVYTDREDTWLNDEISKIQKPTT